MSDEINYSTQELQAVRGLSYGLVTDAAMAADKAEYATPEKSRLEIVNGVAAFALAGRQDAWHKLGQRTVGKMTAEQAMTNAHLGWLVSKQQIQANVNVEATFDDSGAYPGYSGSVVIPDQFATVRQNPFTGEIDVLGVVGKQYTVVQNLATAEVLNTTCEVTGANIVSAGSLDNGRRVFVCMEIPGGISIGGRDEIQQFLVAENTHDGSSSFRIIETPIRTVCWNTLKLGKSKAASQVALRHSSSIEVRMAEAKKVLGVTNKFMEEFRAMGEHLLAQDVTKSEFDALIDAVWEPAFETTGKAAGTETKRTRDRRNDLQALMWDAETQDNIRGTGWGAYNAFVEYSDWIRPISKPGEAKNPNLRAELIMTGNGDKVKTRVLELLS